MYKTFRFEGMEISSHRDWKSAYRRRKAGRPICLRPWSVLLAIGAAGMMLPATLFA